MYLMLDRKGLPNDSDQVMCIIHTLLDIICVNKASIYHLTTPYFKRNYKSKNGFVLPSTVTVGIEVHEW